MAIAGVTYFNFAWLREQLCIIMCPYGRMQSVLVDRDSLVIGYDTRRGEPRGKVKQAGRGECVDCLRCVAVCPTGIDIRNGLQMECLACAQCIDACDEIMDKLGQPRGLIRYDSQRGLEGETKKAARPRLWAYGALFAVALVALGLSTGERMPLEATLLRAPGAPFVVDGGVVRNQFAVHVVNKSATPAAFALTAKSAGADVVVAQPAFELKPLESIRVPLFVTIAPAQLAPGQPLDVTVQMTPAGHAPIVLHVDGKLLGPPHP
jgi:cytochrome c oxidase accessory protein FixG